MIKKKTSYRNASVMKMRSLLKSEFAYISYAFLLKTNNENLQADIFNRSPITEFPFYMVVETSGSNGTHDEEKLSNFLESSYNNGIIQDGTLTSNPVKVNVSLIYLKRKQTTNSQ